jgi:outer membrane protein assembly factor BamB
MGLGGGGRVSALRARDGTVIWSVTIGGASPAMTVTNDVVYVAHSLGSIVTTGSSSTVVALRSDNGARIWSAAALPEDFYGAAVTVAGHTAYVYGGDGKLYALRS